MRKYILPFLAGVFPYLLVLVFLYLMWFTPEVVYAALNLNFTGPMLIFCLILLLCPILGFVCLMTGLLSTDFSPSLLAKQNLAVKLAHIPFYVVLFLLVFLAVPLFAPVIFLLDLSVLLLGSSFGIAAIIRARLNGLISTGQAVLHIILHCIFVLDVISAVLLWRKLNAATNHTSVGNGH
ncbi:MAG: hypothetical protein IKD27_06080 [Oscillospiraceae bacterium]|nr:hypothetical protein [Oscillospiraceae bacterium]